jgi:hypothetical protein
MRIAFASPAAWIGWLRRPAQLRGCACHGVTGAPLRTRPAARSPVRPFDAREADGVAIRFLCAFQGEGWYFIHGTNWGFQCDLIAHRVKGYRAVIMTNGDAGFPVIQQLRRRIQQEYEWDALDPRVPRGYGPN